MFFQKAYHGRNAWWRWALTVGGTLAVWMLGHIPLLSFMIAMQRRLGLGEQAFIEGDFPAGVDRNLFLLLLLTPFVLAFLAFWLLLRLLHERPLRSVTTGRARFNWARALAAFFIWLVITGAATVLFLPASAYHYQFNPAQFWPLLVIAVLVLPFQTSIEEVLFRGYLMQGLSILSGNKIAPLVIVTLVFVLVHLSNREFSAADYTTGALAYLSLSALFGLAAVLDDGLEVPCGIHAANNFFLAVFLSPSDGSLTTYSIFTSTLADLMKPSPWLDIAQALVGLGVFYFVFGWRFSTLFTPTRPQAGPSRRRPEG